MARTIKPPAALPPLDSETPLLFLAGSIEQGRAAPWQRRVATALADIESLVILDPRRDDWDATWSQSIAEPQFRAQVEWELEGLERADVVAMYFDPTTRSPITLLELGLCARASKLVVYCPDSFWRKGNVDVVCQRYGIAQVADEPTFVHELRSRIGSARQSSA